MPRPQSPNSVKKALRKIALTEKRLAANRANAQLSTGPRTPEGKARSAANAVKHGFAGATFAVIRPEDMREVDNLKADAVSVYRPANAQEMAAVERIALAQHQIFLAYRFESGLFTTAFDSAVDHEGRPITPMRPDMIEGNVAVTRAQNRNYALAEGVRRLARKSNIFSLMLRYQAQAERQYRLAVEELERLRALRDVLPNEPTLPTQPQEKPDLATFDDLNIRRHDGPCNPNPDSSGQSRNSQAPNPQSLSRPTAKSYEPGEDSNLIRTCIHRVPEAASG
jgi:hypothetical protein